MSNIENLRLEIQTWSLTNFGVQRSKYDQTVVLGHLAPLLGVAEEAGEYSQACEKGCLSGKKDAIADMVIFLFDFASRLDINFESYTVESSKGREVLQQEIGILFHHVLKMHQGIRGYDDKEFALTEIKESIFSVFDVLHEVCNQVGVSDPFSLATETFMKTVSKRDWSNKPEDGGNHNHEAV